MKQVKMVYMVLTGGCCVSGWVMQMILQDPCQTCLWLRLLWTLAFVMGILSFVRPFFEKGMFLTLFVISCVSFQKASFPFFKNTHVVVKNYGLMGEGVFCRIPQILGIPLSTWSFFLSVLCLSLLLIPLLKKRRHFHGN